MHDLHGGSGQKVVLHHMKEGVLLTTLHDANLIHHTDKESKHSLCGGLALSRSDGHAHPSRFKSTPYLSLICHDSTTC